MNLHFDPAEFVPLIEAAEALGVPPSTLDTLRRDARLPAVKLNGLVLFKWASLDARAAAREEGR